MSHKNTTNDNNYQYYHIVIGDILLHSEIKPTPIQVQLLTATSSQINEEQNIPRLLPNPAGMVNNQTGILCDLKNSTMVKLTYERKSSAKKLMHIHKAGRALIKQLKSKIITINNIETKLSTISTDSNNEQIHF
jgi:hypothetical protein